MQMPPRLGQAWLLEMSRLQSGLPTATKEEEQLLRVQLCLYSYTIYSLHFISNVSFIFYFFFFLEMGVWFWEWLDKLIPLATGIQITRSMKWSLGGNSLATRLRRNNFVN